MAEGLEFLLELDAKLDGAVGMNKALKEIDANLKGVDAGLKKVEATTANASTSQGRLAGMFGRLKIAGQFVSGFFSGAFSEASKLMAERHRQHGDEVDRLEKKTKKAGFTFADVFKFETYRRAISGTIDLVGFLGKELLHVGENALEVAAQNERTGKSFELLFGAKEGKETLEWIDQIAQHTEFTDDELKGMAGSLAKVGFAGEGLTRALAASLDMAAFSGNGQAGADAALSALEKIKQTGDVGARTLMGLGISKKDFFAEMTLRTGEGAKALKKKLHEGKIDAEVSLEALYSMIAKKTGKNLGGAGVTMGETFAARLKHLKDLPDQFFQKLSGSEGFAKISAFTGKLVDALDPDSASGKKIMGGLTAAFDSIGNMLGDVDLDKVITQVSQTLKDLPANLAPVARLFGVLYDMIAGTVSVIAKLLSYIPGVTAYVNLIKGGVEEDKKYRSALDAFNQKTKSNWGTPEPDAPEWLKKGKSMGRNLEAGTREALDTHSPSKVFEDIGKNVGDGFNQGVNKSMGQSDGVARAALSVPASPGSVAGARGSVQVTIDVGGVHVSGAGGDAAQLAQQISAHLASMAPGAIQNAIEQLAGQAGSA